MNPILFDCNCMLGKWKHNIGECFDEPADLLSVMNRVGIKKALVHGSYAKFGQMEHGNRTLFEAVKAQPGLWPCATAMPHHTGEFMSPCDFMQTLKEFDVRAVRIFPVFHGIELSRWLWADLLAELEKAGVPLFIDLGMKHWSEPIDWDMIHSLLVAYPDLPIVMIRMGVKADRYVYALLEKCKNLYLDTSYYLVNNGIRRMTDRFGAERLLFGTGMPIYGPKPPIAMLALSSVTDAQKAKIGGGNLEALLEGVDFDVC